jgi:hypothetical protein
MLAPNGFIADAGLGHWLYGVCRLFPWKAPHYYSESEEDTAAPRARNQNPA